jgi:hypothetical protein
MYVANKTMKEDYFTSLKLALVVMWISPIPILSLGVAIIYHFVLKLFNLVNTEPFRKWFENEK